MSLPLYMDHHVHSAITRALADRGLDVLTVLEDGFSEQQDADILERAVHLRRILFTQDEDFLVLTRQWQNSGREFAGVVFGPQLSTTIGTAVCDLEIICRVLTADEICNQVVFLPV